MFFLQIYGSNVLLFFFPEVLHMEGVVAQTSEGAHSIGSRKF